jgi:nitrogen fixation-related uncharacterized protein
MTTTDPTRRPTLPPPDAGVMAPAGGTPLPRARRMRLTVQRLDPWSVLRLSFLLSVAVAVVTVVAMLLLWGLMASGGVFTSLETSANDILGGGSDTITRYFDFSTVLWVSVLLAVADVVLITALATLGAFLFNLATSLAGGLELSVVDEG